MTETSGPVTNTGSSPAPDAGMPGNERWPAEDEISLIQLVNTLLRRRRIIVVTSGGISLFVLLWLLVFSSALTYTSTASFIPQASAGSASGLVGLAGQFGFRMPANEPGQSPEFYAELITSRAVVGAMAEEIFRFQAEREGELEVRSGTLPDLLELAEDGSNAERREASIRWLIEGAITVSTDRETGIVEVSIKTPWAGLSQALADRLIEMVNEFNLETRQSRGAAERIFVEGRLAEARDSLRSAENRYETFLAGNRQLLGNRTTSPELMFERDRLQRQVTMQQELYTSLAQAHEQARITEVRNTPAITVLERPEVPVRADPRGRLLKLILGVILGGMLGVFLAFVQEYMGRVRDQEDDDYQELTHLWSQSWADIRTLGGRIGGRSRAD